MPSLFSFNDKGMVAVSIAILHLERARPMTDEDLANYKDQMKLRAFAHGVAFAAAFNGRLADVSPLIEEAVLSNNESYREGRCSLQPITSTWAKERYPDAMFEMIHTIVSLHNPNDTHVLIIYFP